MRKLLTIFGFALFCSACTAGGDGFQEIDVSHQTPAVTGETGSSTTSFVQTLAVQPAFTKIKGIGKTLQLSADIWLEGGDVVNDVQKSFTLPAGDAEETVTWNTDNFGVATVDENGLVTTVSAGDTYITANVGGHEAVARIIVESESTTDPNVDLSNPE